MTPVILAQFPNGDALQSGLYGLVAVVLCGVFILILSLLIDCRKQYWDESRAKGKRPLPLTKNESLNRSIDDYRKSRAEAPLWADLDKPPELRRKATAYERSSSWEEVNAKRPQDQAQPKIKMPPRLPRAKKPVAEDKKY